MNDNILDDERRVPIKPKKSRKPKAQTIPAEPKPLKLEKPAKKPKRKMSEKQLDNLRKGREVRKKRLCQPVLPLAKEETSEPKAQVYHIANDVPESVVEKPAVFGGGACEQVDSIDDPNTLHSDIDKFNSIYDNYQFQQYGNNAFVSYLNGGTNTFPYANSFSAPTFI